MYVYVLMKVNDELVYLFFLLYCVYIVQLTGIMYIKHMLYPVPKSIKYDILVLKLENIGVCGTYYPNIPIKTIPSYRNRSNLFETE